jgi:hypothetical protein
LADVSRFVHPSQDQTIDISQRNLDAGRANIDPYDVAQLPVKAQKARPAPAIRGACTGLLQKTFFDQRIDFVRCFCA